MNKYLIRGLGNLGYEYEGIRHNTGFVVLGAFVKVSNIVLENKRYGFVIETTVKGQKIILLKSTASVNFSRNAIHYWLNKENIDQSRLLVVSDDVALPLGAFRLKGNGSNGGYNGSGHTQQLIGQNHIRLRMGVGDDYLRGGQVDRVLGRYSDEEMEELQPTIDLDVDIIKSPALAGVDITMNRFNELGEK